jgi:uncharacterized protein (TIGR02996 family)
VTTEDDFQAKLDANPDDWQTRLVFADWLQERGDPRAEGYRALGLLRRVPRLTVRGLLGGTRRPDQWSFVSSALEPGEWHWKWDAQRLPWHWSKKVANRHVNESRRAIEDVAALAFAELPVERRAELIATEEGTCPS